MLIIVFQKLIICLRFAVSMRLLLLLHNIILEIRIAFIDFLISFRHVLVKISRLMNLLV